MGRRDLSAMVAAGANQSVRGGRIRDMITRNITMVRTATTRNGKGGMTMHMLADRGFNRANAAAFGILACPRWEESVARC